MINLFHDWFNNIFKRDKESAFPFGETTAVISSIIFGIIGLVIFSYYAQSAGCIDYNDKRRTFSTFTLIGVIIVIYLYSMIYIGGFMINYKKEDNRGSGVDYNPWAIVAGILTFAIVAILPSIFIGFAVDLTLKPENDYDNLQEEHPIQYSIILAVSGFLILGSTLPLMNYVGQKIINPPQATIFQV